MEPEDQKMTSNAKKNVQSFVESFQQAMMLAVLLITVAIDRVFRVILWFY